MRRGLLTVETRVMGRARTVLLLRIVVLSRDSTKWEFAVVPAAPLFGYMWGATTQISRCASTL
jgi:hypothetical protein